jgi:hypothetical protein
MAALGSSLSDGVSFFSPKSSKNHLNNDIPISPFFALFADLLRYITIIQPEALLCHHPSVG